MNSKELVKQAGDFADADNLEAAAEIVNRVLLEEPDNPGALYVLGCTLLKAARQVQVIQVAKRITNLCPRDFRGWSLLCLAWGELHRYDESIRNARKALECKRSAKTLADLCYALTNAGEWDEASRTYDAAMYEIQRSPDEPLTNEALTNCRVSIGYIRLAQGRWKEGFDAYRATLRTKWRKERVYDAPGGDTKEWGGEPDATVIVTGEQGLGDEIMAAGVIPDAAARCRKFIFDCDARLATLFARSFPNVLVVGGRRQEQLQIPASVGLPTHHKTLFGLAEVCRGSDADFPRKPYLIADEGYRSMFRDLFGGQRTVGLAWSGGLPRTGQEPRAAGLNAFLPLLRKGEAEFVSLQYKNDGEEVARFEQEHGIRVRRLPWVAQGQDMDLLAGLVASCDEVVGVHTTALHLSSALGVPTTVLTHRGSGWRYAGEELLWYPPTTKMHRKRTGESWRDCVARLK